MINFNVAIANTKTGSISSQQLVDWLEKVSGGRIINDNDKKDFLKYIRDTRFGEDSNKFRITPGADNEKNYRDLFLNRINNQQITVNEVAQVIWEKENLKLKHIRVFDARISQNSTVKIKDILPHEISELINKEYLYTSAPKNPKLTSIAISDQILRFKYVFSVEFRHLKRSEVTTINGTEYSPWEKILIRKVMNIDIIPALKRVVVRSEATTDREYEESVLPILVKVMDYCQIRNYSPVNMMKAIDSLINIEIVSDCATLDKNTQNEHVVISMRDTEGKNLFEGNTFSQIDQGDDNFQHAPVEYAKLDWINFNNMTTYVSSQNGFIKFTTFQSDPNGDLNGILQHLDAAFLQRS